MDEFSQVFLNNYAFFDKSEVAHYKRLSKIYQEKEFMKEKNIMLFNDRKTEE